MTVFLFIILWFVLVIVHALVRLYLYPLYFDLKPSEKISKCYLTWTENFTYNHSIIRIKSDTNLMNDTIIHYRVDIQLKGLYRALFKPLTFNEELKKLNNKISDLNAINPSKFFDAKKRGKINL